MSAANWARDLSLGVRLAVGGGRNSWSRLLLTAVGVGLGVAVMLLAAAMPAADAARGARSLARMADVPVTESSQPTDAADAPLLRSVRSTDFHGTQVRIEAYDVLAADAPRPPGVAAWPADGTMLASPALAELLGSPAGELLKPRVDWPITGTVGDEGLREPGELLAYVSTPLDPADASPVTGFGLGEAQPVPIELVLLMMAAATIALVPVLVLLAAATRIAAAARDRRLAALRLIGADLPQVRRLASAEALVGALGGVVLGAVFFLIGRQIAAEVSLLGLSVFAGDLVPPLWLTLSILVFVPVLSVLTAVLALRRTAVNPLGVTRDSTPPRRRLWWRLVPMLLGLGLLLSQAGSFRGDPGNLRIALVMAGIALTAIAVPVLLPWLVQNAVRPLAGGPPSWLLAIRRIQLDSGTPARAAGGLAAVLTGAIAFQTMLASALASDIDWNHQRIGDDIGLAVRVSQVPADKAAELAALTDVPGTLAVYRFRDVFGESEQNHTMVRVADCATLAVFATIGPCADGDVFQLRSEHATPVAVGSTLDFVEFDNEGEPASVGQWTVPATRTVEPFEATTVEVQPGALLATPGALPPELLATPTLRATVVVNGDDPDAPERVANAVAALSPTASASQINAGSTATTLRNTLLVGALIVLLLAAASLLIVSIEQVRERRKQLAALAASGVGGRTLGASVLWQAAVPFGVATIASLVVGTALGVLLMRVFDLTLVLDWAGMAVFVAASAAAVLLVTALTLPALRSATRPDGLRTE